MAPEAAYLAELKATKRPILRQHCLQRACNNLQPGALTRLYLQLPSIGGRALCQVAPEFKYMTAPARRRAAMRPPMQQQPDFGRNLHFSTPDVDPANKTLFIIFSGQSGFFFIPFAALLSLLPDGSKDILAVRAKGKQFHVGGDDGPGRNPFSVANALREIFRTAEYERVVVMGLSSGGIFCQRVAEHLGADICLSFAGVYADEGFRLKSVTDTGVPAFDPICACRPSNVGRIINVVASKNEFDVKSSLRLKNVRPSLREFHLVNGNRHNVLKPMLKAGYGRLFMRMALARNGAMIWLVSSLTKAYGLLVVRGMRQAFGLQKVESWYVAHKVDSDLKDR